MLLCFTFNMFGSLVCFPEVQPGPRGLIARRVTEVAQSTLDMVSTAVDYPLCECTSTVCQLRSSRAFHFLFLCLSLDSEAMCLNDAPPPNCVVHTYNFQSFSV